jgi:hypothetical protein
MESSQQKRRFPQPWSIEQDKHGFKIVDANGIQLAAVYCRDDLHKLKFGDYAKYLTSDEARRIAKAIARLPEFLRKEPAFEPRRHGRYWKASHPYHVALAEHYVSENYDEIVACCAYNNVPFQATGEILDRGIRWRTYAFARQFDAIRFWAMFDGRWLVDNEFQFPQCPEDLPRMVALPRRSGR